MHIAPSGRRYSVWNNVNAVNKIELNLICRKLKLDTFIGHALEAEKPKRTPPTDWSRPTRSDAIVRKKHDINYLLNKCWVNTSILQ